MFPSINNKKKLAKAEIDNRYTILCAHIMQNLFGISLTS